MEKFIVVANFACHYACEDDISSSQWLVGTFDTAGEGVAASLDDLHAAARDHYKCVLPDDGFEEDEYESLLAEKVGDYMSDYWERAFDDILSDLEMNGSAEVIFNDFVDADYTDQRQIVKYYIHKLTF